MDEIPRNWRPRDVPGLEILRGAFRRHVFPRHTHDGLMLALLEGGAQRLTYRGEDHIAGPGRIVAIAPDEAHAGGPGAEAGWRYSVVTVSSPMLDRIPGAAKGAVLGEWPPLAAAPGALVTLAGLCLVTRARP